MTGKKKLIVSLSGVSIFLIISLFALKYISEGTYRKQLPEYPDFQTIPKNLQNQILRAGRKAHFNTKDDNLGMLGMVYYSSANYDKASLCFQLAVKKNSRKWLWSYYLGNLNLELGKSDEAIENFKHVIVEDPKNFLALYYMGEASQNIGSIDNAEEIFRNIAALHDNDLLNQDTIRENGFPIQTYSKFHLARIYMDSGRLDSAELTLKEIIDSHITFGPAYRLLGDVYTRMGKISLGNKYAIRANDLVSYAPPGDMLTDKIALMSRSGTYLLKQIDDAVRSLNFNWALMLFDQALKWVPENKFILSKALYGYLNLGYDKKALPFLDQHLGYFSDDFNELLLFATILYNKGLKQEAMKYFKHAKELSPGNSRLAIWLTDRNLNNDAVILLNDQLKNDPENVTILTDAVRIFSVLGEKEKANVYLTTLKKLFPRGPEIKKLTGEVLENEGNKTGALSVYEDALKTDPENLFIIKHLANLYIQNQMWDKLIRHFRMSLGEFPNEPFLLEGLGRVLINCPDKNLRNIEEGREYSERAYINFKSPVPTKLSAGRNLATAYTVSGDKLKATFYMKSIMDMDRKWKLSQVHIP